MRRNIRDVAVGHVVDLDRRVVWCGVPNDRPDLGGVVVKRECHGLEGIDGANRLAALGRLAQRHGRERAECRQVRLQRAEALLATHRDRPVSVLRHKLVDAAPFRHDLHVLEDKAREVLGREGWCVRRLHDAVFGEDVNVPGVHARLEGSDEGLLRRERGRVGHGVFCVCCVVE